MRSCRCGHEADAYGTGSGSVKAALAQLREGCPEGENNFYIAEEGYYYDDGL